MNKPLFSFICLLVVAVTGCAERSSMLPSPTREAERLQVGTMTRSVVYVADVSNTVSYFPADLQAKNPKPLGMLTNGITRAQGLWVDRNGTLYVTNASYPATLVEFKRGAITPFKTIGNGLYVPMFPAVGSSGTLYVVDSQSGGVILVFPPGANAPTRTIAIPHQGHSAPGSMGFDKNGDILVATFDVVSKAAYVYRITPGSWTVTNLGLAGLPGNQLGTDGAGNIYVGGIEGTISVYAPGSKTPTRTIDAGATGFYSTITVTAAGAVYWPNYDSGEMYEFAPGASAPTNEFAGGGGVDAAVGPR